MATKEAKQQANEIRGTGFARPNEAEQRANDLDDPKVQHEITHPSSKAVEIGDESVEIYPLVASKRMALIGLTHSITTSAIQEDKGRGNGYSFAVRSQALIAENYLDRLIPLVAIATKKPGEIKPQEAREAEIHIYHALRYEQIPSVYAAMQELNGVMDAIAESQKRDLEKK